MEETLAAIESANYALATSSGMSAIVLAFSAFPVGSKVLAVRDLYGGSSAGLLRLKQKGALPLPMPIQKKNYSNNLTEDIDIVYIETPTNPLMVEFDIARISQAAHERGAAVIVDNTFYSPIYQRPLEDGADIVLHSATKYLRAQ